MRKGGKVISVAHNIMSTHPRFPQLWSRHAELNAIILAQCDIIGTEIYVYRETYNRLPAMAKPCDTCFAYIVESGITKIYYTTGTGNFFETIEI